MHRWVALFVTLCVSACRGDISYVPRDGSSSGGSATIDRSAAIWTGSVEFSSGGSQSVTVVTMGNTWFYAVPATGQSAAIYFDNIDTSPTGAAYLFAAKGTELSNGLDIDSGTSEGQFLTDSRLSLDVDYTTEADSSIYASVDKSMSKADASASEIAGRYSGTASDGTHYDFEITTDLNFVGTDSLGCSYTLTNTARRGRNLYSSSGPYDPNCDSGGANFIDAAYWSASFKTTTWFVEFRQQSFVLTLKRA